MIRIYTDGSAICNKKDSPTGYAFYIPECKILDGGFMIGTNNIGELTAIQRGLSFVYQMRKRIGAKKIEVISDSEYAILVLTKPANLKANVKLILAIKKLIETLNDCGFEITFRHVGAHGKTVEGQSQEDSINNSLVDKLANNFANSKGNYTAVTDEKGNFAYNFLNLN